MPERGNLPPRPRDVLRDGTDVRHWSDRELLVRAVDATLDLAHQIGQLTAAISAHERRIGAIEERIQRLESAPRPMAPSLQEIADVVDDALEEHTNPGHEPEKSKRTDSERVRAELARVKGEEAIAAQKLQDEENRKVREARRSVIYGIVGTVATAAILALTGFLWAALQREAALRDRVERGGPPVTIPVPVPTPFPTATAATVAPAAAGSTIPEAPGSAPTRLRPR